MQESVKLIGYGVDTLILNVRYADKHGQPVKQELDEQLAATLEYLQNAARAAETAVASDWSFLGVLLFVEPHGAGKQWRWLLTCRLLSVAVSRGRFNDLIAQVRFSSEFLWSQACTGDALYRVHDFLMGIFGEDIHLQVSEIHLCADVVGYDFSQCDYEALFVTRVRKNEALFGVDSVALNCHRVATLAFSKHKAPLSCAIYNKSLEIAQKSGKTWFYDLWKSETVASVWDGESEVWRVEFRFKRQALHEFQIEWAYDVLDQLKRLWDYAAGHIVGGDDGLPDGWLRYVLPSEDSNRSRWPVHPAWAIVQNAFSSELENNLGPLVRKRIREKNVERGIASTIGYISTLAAWLGGDYASPDADVSLMLHWLADVGPEYLESKSRDFVQEVRKKQKRYGNTGDSLTGESEVAS
ncbi:MAG TPA: hypothetical protein VNG51_29160 [Ktedonobacteraceae bacterium]|nr:hypothetical protein [Ktedonobacteraceae bacterium]